MLLVYRIGAHQIQSDIKLSRSSLMLNPWLASYGTAACSTRGGKRGLKRVLEDTLIVDGVGPHQNQSHVKKSRSSLRLNPWLASYWTAAFSTHGG